MAGNNPMSVPDLQSLEQYNVNRAGQIEGVRQSLYDFQTYPLAGSTQLTFFQSPIGQNGKTKADTNMTVAGSLPAPQRFLVQSIECHFFPGNAVSKTGGAVLASNLADCYAVANSGWLDFFIGSKSYLTEAPIGRFPPANGLAGVEALADTTTAAASRLSITDYARFGGEPYKLSPPILLVPTQNFNVTLNWPTAVPITANARVGIVMKGILYRNSQ